MKIIIQDFLINFLWFKELSCQNTTAIPSLVLSLGAGVSPWTRYWFHVDAAIFLLMKTNNGMLMLSLRLRLRMRMRLRPLARMQAAGSQAGGSMLGWLEGWLADWLTKCVLLILLAHRLLPAIGHTASRGKEVGQLATWLWPRCGLPDNRGEQVVPNSTRRKTRTSEMEMEPGPI